MNFAKIVIAFFLSGVMAGTLSTSGASLIFHSAPSSAGLIAPPPAQGGKIVENPDIPPVFTGGTAEMHRFISSNLSYPDEAVAQNLQGLVVYTFVVEEDGTLTDFDLIHHADPLLNEEALRILKAMPAWRPGKYKDRIVRTKSYVPMYFRLNKNAARARRSAPVNTAKTDVDIAQSEVFSIVDKMPEYTYGQKGLTQFIEHQMRYPVEARQQGIEGRILCSFIVAADGTISNIEVVQGIHPLLDKEAVRVLSLMPRWNPGENDGEKVNVKCLLPIDFTIDEEPIPPLVQQ